MNPEQRLLVIHKYLAVKIKVFLFCAVTRMLCPQRVRIVDRDFTAYDLRHLSFRTDLNLFLFAVLLLLLVFCILRVLFDDRILVRNFIRRNIIVLDIGSLFYEEYWGRHE